MIKKENTMIIKYEVLPGMLKNMCPVIVIIMELLIQTKD